MEVRWWELERYFCFLVGFCRPRAHPLDYTAPSCFWSVEVHLSARVGYFFRTSLSLERTHQCSFSRASRGADGQSDFLSSSSSSIPKSFRSPNCTPVFRPSLKLQTRSRPSSSTALRPLQGFLDTALDSRRQPDHERQTPGNPRASPREKVDLLNLASSLLQYQLEVRPVFLRLDQCSTAYGVLELGSVLSLPHLEGSRGSFVCSES